MRFSVFGFVFCHYFHYFPGYGIKLGDHGARSSPIESLLFPPNGQFFYTKYARQSQPVLFKGAASHWPAVKKWPNITYLKEEHGKDVFTVEFRKNFQASFPMRKNLKLQMFFEQYKRKNIYLDSLFGKDSRMIDEVYFPLPLISISHRVSVDNLNLLVSSGNTSSAFHQDGYENLLTVVSGYKDVILYDNRYTRDFDADRYSIAAGVLDMDPENLTTADLKKLAEIPYYTARIEPGMFFFFTAVTSSSYIYVALAALFYMNASKIYPLKCPCDYCRKLIFCLSVVLEKHSNFGHIHASLKYLYLK